MYSKQYEAKQDLRNGDALVKRGGRQKPFDQLHDQVQKNNRHTICVMNETCWREVDVLSLRTWSRFEFVNNSSFARRVASKSNTRPSLDNMIGSVQVLRRSRKC